jgi:phosphoglycolate phosphatase-like HAD superfamily hydrolase
VVVLDFDGTLSLLRTGWQAVMAPLMVEVLLPFAGGRSEEQMRALVDEDIARSTGRQTIYQMIGLTERVREFGGEPADPWRYKEEYDRRLLAHIAGRRQAVAEGAEPDRFLLAGARAFLDALDERGLTCVLVSGTDVEYVREEAQMLGIARYFDGRVHAATPDYRASGKQAVLKRLLDDGTVSPDRLAVFGDGFVEIEEAKRVGGYAVGLAGDEEAGGLSAWKRCRLLQAGADAIVADFQPRDALLRLLGMDA